MLTPDYVHTQSSPVRFVLLAFVTFCLMAAWLWRTETLVWVCMLSAASVLVFVMLTMTTLTVRNEGDHLAVRFGPLPIFSTRIPFEEIQSVQAAKSKLMDGWGLHYVPGRGWTWSLWGFDCVEIQHDRANVRIGSDDAPQLAAYLRQRTHE